MENEENVELNTLNESEETVQPEESNQEETLETESEVDVAQLQATNKKLFERAKKAEADLKALKSAPKLTQAQSASSQASVEETVLLANGMPEDLLAELKVVAKVRNVSIIKAQNDPIFVAVKEKFEKDKKTEQASMPASRGSSGVKAKKTFSTPNLSREDHRAMVLGQ